MEPCKPCFWTNVTAQFVYVYFSFFVMYYMCLETTILMADITGSLCLVYHLTYRSIVAWTAPLHWQATASALHPVLLSPHRSRQGQDWIIHYPVHYNE